MLHDLTGFAVQQRIGALIVLNSDSFSLPLLRALWDASDGPRVCADGGANRVFDLLPSLVPDAIVGDLDSARPDVLEYYRGLGAVIHRDDDQDHNDLDKSIKYLGEAENVSILGAFGGRFDQEMASFDCLYRWAGFAQFRLYSDDNLATLLVPGTNHEIKVRKDLEGPHCGLLPLGGKCEEVTTTGLRWNLERAPLEFGQLVSTSNLLEHDVVTVTTSHPLLWTAAFKYY